MTDRAELGQHTTVLGETGAGKTYWARDYLKRCRRVLVVDTEEGYDFNEKEWPVVTLEGLRKSGVLDHPEKPFHWAFRPRPGMEEDDVEALSYLILKKAKSLVVYFDEVTDYSDAHVCGPWFKRLFRKSRKRKVSVMASSQRPAGFNHWFSENSQHYVLFYIGPYDSGNSPIGKMMDDHREEIPYGSFKYVYVAPGNKVHVREKVP